ncbi:Hypothetical predicted protein [Paramuricea clavata]|uniref:Uncharacterized protein n=1 Tax=Paramuricea clavata TaxID=317549 RepID=A0A6S7IBX0_PARCT|nr:Hypothetical predicted protein [Paramuricea clavata]
MLKFSSGKFVAAYLDKEFTTLMLYCNADIFNCLGQDACIVLDVALTCSGCEAILEGFYSVIKVHAKSRGQSNKVLKERAVVDWALPHLLACPSTITKIGKLYTSGNQKLGILKHQSAAFFNVRERAARKYNVSKVVDRHATEPPRCQFLVVEDD